MSIPLAMHAVIKTRRNALQSSLEEFSQTPALPSPEDLDDPDELRRSQRGEVALTDAIGHDVPESVFKPLRKLHASRTTFLTFATIGGATSGYLFLINALSGGSFWALIPAVSIAFPLTVWGILLRNRRQKLRRRLERAQEQARLAPPSAAPVALPSSDHPALRDAQEIRAKIVGLVRTNAPGREDLIERVDGIVAEIGRLAQLERGFDDALAILPLENLRRDRDELAAQRDTASSDMRSRYEESLGQIETQITGLEDLAQKREMVALRVRAGVNSLRQVSIDLVRIKGDQTLAQLDDRIGEQADELSRYFTDLQASFDELSRELGTTGAED